MKCSKVLIITNILLLYILTIMYYLTGINNIFILFSLVESILIVVNCFKKNNYYLPILLIMSCPIIWYPFPILLIINIVLGYLTIFITKDNSSKRKANKTYSKVLNFFEKNKNNKKISYIFYLSITILVLVVLQLFYIQNIKRYFSMNILSLLINVIIVTVIYNILLSISNRVRFSSLVTSIILIILFAANCIVKYYTFDILKISDFLFIPTMGAITTFIGGSIGPLIQKIVLPFILLLVIVVFCYKHYSICNSKIRFNILTRIGLLVSSIIILLVLFIPNQKIDNFMLKYIYQTQTRNDYEADTSSIIYYARYGVLAGMHNNYIENIVFEPIGYNEEGLSTILDNSFKESDKLGKPNIIVVFSESFWDVEKLNDFEFSSEVIPNFNRLKNQGTHLNLLSPSYGGISANVEFELLTGGSVSYYNNGYIPYMQLYNGNDGYKIPSIIKELQNNGYKINILNSSISTLYNCDKVYNYMNVDNKHHFREELNRYPTDKELTDIIINNIENYPTNNYFTLAITMGAHMPYFNKEYDSYDFDVTSKYSKTTNSAVLEYAQRIHDADKQLLRLYEYINTLDEDTILVFFGDHLPFLQDKNGLNVIDEDSYFNTSDELVNIYRKYNTEGLILTNFEVDLNQEMDMNYNFILTYILNNMNIELSNYYKWLNTTRNNLPISNKFVTKINNRLVYTKELTGTFKDTYKLRNNIQYMLFNK